MSFRSLREGPQIFTEWLIWAGKLGKFIVSNFIAILWR